MCSVRVIGESDIMQEFLSESDEVRKINKEIKKENPTGACLLVVVCLRLTGQLVSPSHDLEL